MVELNLIKLCLDKDSFLEATGAGLSSDMFPDKLKPIYSVLHNYYTGENSTTGESVSLSVPSLANLFFASVSKDKDYYQGVFDNLTSLDVSEATTMVLLRSLVKQNKLKELSLAAYECFEGRMSQEKFDGLVEAYKALDGAVEQEEEDEGFVTDDLTEIVNHTYAAPGLRWRLSTLNKMLGSLRKGNFGFVFARPETGKTTFLASEVTFMASQLEDGAGPILWLANEEPGVNIKLRVYQAYFGVDLSQLMSDLKKWEKLFKEQMGGKILILDRAQIHKSQVERLCKKYKPSLIIADQLDKIVGFENDREDLRLGAIYQWARELAKLYCPFIGISQADGTGEGQKWLTMANVANAKTAKQAEADWILGLGCVHAEGYEDIRYLHLSKNKLLGDPDTDPKLRHGKQETLIKKDIARYQDLYD